MFILSARSWFVLYLVAALVGCASVQTTGLVARAGDTVVFGVGWQQGLNQENISITITAGDGATHSILPDDPAIRAVINTYPDPVSNLVVGYETGQKIVGNEPFWGQSIEGAVTGGDRDWSQSVIILDLPAALSAGIATIDITTTGGVALDPVTVEILDPLLVGTGAPDPLLNHREWIIRDKTLKSLERSAHYVVGFAGATIPHAIQIDLLHDPDKDQGGVGRAYVVNTRGDIKNLSWNDDGISLRIIVMPARENAFTAMVDFKFYIAGGITGLLVSDVQAFDINGVPVPNVVAAITPNI